MTTLRIAHAEPRPGRLANGEFQTLGHLVVLADDIGHRAVPIWLGGDLGALYLAGLLDRPADQVITDGVPPELTTRLLSAASSRVTGVDIEVTEAGAGELSPEVTVARIGPAGTRQVTAGLGLSMALAAAGAPIRLADAVLDRLAVPVPGNDLLTPFLDRVPPGATARPGHGLPGWPLGPLPGRRPRYEPRNLDFADGLDRWDLDSGPGPDPDQPRAADGEPDFTAAAEGPSAVLSSTVPRPAGSAALIQAIYADDYRGATLTFSGELRVDPHQRSRYEPRNLTYADSLDHWVLGGSFTENAIQAHWQDYSAAADHGSAVLASAVPQPEGFAWLAQEIFADDYHGTSVTFRGQFRAPGTTGRTGLFLRVTQPQDIRGHLTARAALADPANHIVNLDGPGDWTTHEVTAPIPAEANTVAFGVFLSGPGRIELRNPELTQAGLSAT